MTVLLFAIGCFMVGCGIAYAWWIRIRVWLLRQDLFVIRDGLWYAMRDAGKLDHPAHRKARQNLNVMIRFAPRLSIRVINEFASWKIGDPVFDKCEDLPETAVAMRQANHRYARYILRETLSGFAWFVAGRAEGTNKPEQVDEVERRAAAAALSPQARFAYPRKRHGPMAMAH